VFFLSRQYPTWTARIPAEVKEYFLKKGLSAGQCFMNYYKFLKQQEIPELLQEKKELEERVRQIDIIVTHMSTNCKTNNTLCNTPELDRICQEYIKNDRALENPDHLDRNWIDAQLEKKKLRHIDQNMFLQRCKELKNG